MSVELTLLAQVGYRGHEVAGARLRGLLALLAAEPRTGCGTGRLIESLWPDERPEHPAKALQILVSRARAKFGADLIVSTPAGYRLSLSEEQVDASAVLLGEAAAARCARAGDHAAALEHAEAALALCAGAENWGTGPEDPVSALRAERAVTYRALVRARALALSRLGRAGEAVGPLAEIARAHPRDEDVLGELLRCEAATAGPAAALARYDEYRRTLRAELGTDPGRPLQDVHRELLAHTTPAVRHGVRHEPNPLVGRDDDVAAVVELLRRSRVASVVGAGGLGKTRLAHAVARRAEQRVVHFVPLAGVTSDADVPGDVASALGIGEPGGLGGHRAGRPRGVVGGIADALGDALLVLDNCEHVVSGVADLVSALVSLNGRIRVLCTSRAPLGVSAESVYALPELDLPMMAELFGQRARAARPDVELPDEPVTRLCARLDGLPLAVELAAARVRVMSVPEIARRLDDRFALLRGGARDSPRRHRTLHAVIEWSWQLLDPRGQAAMRALSVFPGGFTAEAARLVLGGDADLEPLVGQSLLKVTDTGAGARFRMLETVREFSAAQRDDAGETGRAIDGLFAWVRVFGETQEQPLLADDIIAAAGAIREEQDNLVQALRHGLDREDGATVAAATALLGALWLTESNFTRLITLAGDTAWVLSHYRPAPADLEATRAAVVLCAVWGLLVRRNRPLRTLVTLRRLPQAEPDTLIRALHTALCVTDVPTLLKLCEDERPLLAGMASYVASYLWENDNDLGRALPAAKRMLACFEHEGSPLIRAVAYGRVAELCLESEPGEEAYRCLRAGMEIVERLGWTVTVARGQWALMLASLQCGAFDEAEQWLEGALRSGADDMSGMLGFDVCARAEILLGRGEIEAGLALWRQVAGELAGEEGEGGANWVLQIQAVAVVTHAHHGRLDLVRDLAGDLARQLSTVVTSAPVADFRLAGSLLYALAVAELHRGEAAAAARMIALALRFGLLQSFYPTMSPERARRIAEQADGPAYADAVSEYAGLGHDGLRAAALAYRTGSRENSARAHR